MHADKIKDFIVYGIPQFVKDFLIHDTKGKCFTYRFNETIASKVEKQYNGYISHSHSNFLSKSL